MQRLPIFPLPVVLFPGVPMPLHIFEPRYRQMVAHCIEGDGRFGLVYHDPDRHGPFTAEAEQVGCVAKILELQPMPDGRSTVLTRGQERFRLRDGIESGSLYYEGLVEEYEDEPEDPLDVQEHRRHSMELYRSVMERVTEHAQPIPPVDEESLVSFQIAQWIYIDPAWQQELLEMRSESARLERIDSLLLAALEEM